MADWALVRQYGEASLVINAAGFPGSWVKLPVFVTYINDATVGAFQRDFFVGDRGPVTSGSDQGILTRAFPVLSLSNPDAVRQHIIDAVIDVGANNVFLGGPRDYFVDAAHIVFLPPDQIIPAVPPGVPAGVIAVLRDSDPIPSGWALCDGTNGTPDLTDVFRPKDHAVYIQKL